MIRPVSWADLPDLLELWAVLGNRMAPDELEASFRRMAADPAYGTAVFEADGRAVGFVTWVRVLAMGLPEGYLKINGLAVLPAYRGRGFGRALLEHAEAWGRQRGLSHVLLNSGVRRESAHAFYRHLGYGQDSWCFDKGL